MKFAIVSKDNNIEKLVKTLDRFGISIGDRPEFVITHGGDGTILQGEREYPGIPKITIRASEGGQKCLYDESDLENVLLKIMDGKYRIRKEKKLETIFQGKKYTSLNETQIHNANPIRAIRFSVYENSHAIYENVIADGVIIATPFGSTAYYSSVGGKIFGKGVGIAINNSYKIKYKPMVIDEGFNITIRVKIIREEGLLLFDNDERMIRLKEGDDVKINVSKDTAKFVII